MPVEAWLEKTLHRHCLFAIVISALFCPAAEAPGKLPERKAWRSPWLRPQGLSLLGQEPQPPPATLTSLFCHTISNGSAPNDSPTVGTTALPSKLPPVGPIWSVFVLCKVLLCHLHASIFMCIVRGSSHATTSDLSNLLQILCDHKAKKNYYLAFYYFF